MASSKSLEAGGACSIARTLGIVGERWSLLIVREALKGRTRFSEFQAALHVSTDILTARLEGLVDAGILEPREYKEPGSRPRSGYHLTAAGHDLVPVLAALMSWGDTHLAANTGPPALMRRRGTSEAVHVALVDEQGRAVARDEVEVVPGPGAGLPPRARRAGARTRKRRGTTRLQAGDPAA
jgi:DNA-binding HxlR family transcriptional regulator